MLPKKRRISRKEFPYILSKGKRYNSPHLLLYVAKIDNSPETKDSRFSFSISKKVHPLAVDRNKSRRRGYSIINKNLAKIRPGYLCFFSFKKGNGEVSFNDLEKEVLELLSASGVII